MHIGQRIREIVRHRGCSVAWLARGLHTVRGNVYDMFERESMDTKLLCRLSVLLNYNFLRDVMEEVDREIEGAEKKVRNRTDSE